MDVDSFSSLLKQGAGACFKKNVTSSLVVANNEVKGFRNGLWVLVAMGLFSSLLAIYTMLQHLKYYKEPRCQRPMVRILGLIPIGSAMTVLLYQFYSLESVFVLVRSIYSGMAVVDMGELLNAATADDDHHLQDKLEDQPHNKLPFPLSMVRFHANEDKHLPKQRLALHQFSCLYPIMSLVNSILAGTGVQCPFDLNLTKPLPYLEATSFSSGLVAIYSLLTFFKAVKNHLHGGMPLRTLIFFLVLGFSPIGLSLLFDIIVYYNGIKDGAFFSSRVLGIKGRAITEMIIIQILALSGLFLASFKSFHGNRNPEPTDIGPSLYHVLEIRELFTALGESLKFLIGFAVVSKPVPVGKSRQMLEVDFSQQHRRTASTLHELPEEPEQKSSTIGHKVKSSEPSLMEPVYISNRSNHSTVKSKHSERNSNSTAKSTIPSTVRSSAQSSVPSTVRSNVPSTAPSTVPSTAPSTVPSTIPSTKTPSTKSSLQTTTKSSNHSRKSRKSVYEVQELPKPQLLPTTPKSPQMSPRMQASARPVYSAIEDVDPTPFNLNPNRTKSKSQPRPTSPNLSPRLANNFVASLNANLDDNQPDPVFAQTNNPKPLVISQLQSRQSYRQMR